MKITGQDILNSIPGEHLIQLAITKLLMEGTNRDEITEMVPILAWQISIQLKEKKEI